MNSTSAARQPFLPVVRELVRAYQAFAQYDARGHRGTGLTVPQADVIFTLGNTSGLTFGEIGEKTLITKGTLTGVIDRLEQKGLVERVACPEDRRCTRAALTQKGTKLFEKRFPEHIVYLAERFDRLSAAEQRDIRAVLSKLRAVF